jgi:hypothetical protein
VHSFYGCIHLVCPYKGGVRFEKIMLNFHINPHPGAMEAHPGAMEAHHGAMENTPGAVEGHPGT